jgi:hypothetical protein
MLVESQQSKPKNEPAAEHNMQKAAAALPCSHPVHGAPSGSIGCTGSDPYTRPLDGLFRSNENTCS